MKIIKFNLNKVSYLGEYRNGRIFPLEKNNSNFLLNPSKIYSGQILNEKDIEILQPLPFNKTVYAVAENYSSKKSPLIFYKDKSNNAVILKEEITINIPSDIENLWVEAELGFIVAKDINYKSKNIIDSSFIFGHFLANDITATFKDEDHHLLFSKSTPGFLQIGKVIHKNYLIKDNYISLKQDNLLLRNGKISSRKLNDIDILNFLREHIEINAGDSILTGAPSRCRERLYLKNNHIIEFNIDNLDSIKSRFIINSF
tara:strand:+ start:13790 stop:14563 length:774 start_codon:yes stop_codon:yes gene_type:complete